MASPGLEQPQPVSTATEPVVLYIVVPLVLWAVRWILIPAWSHSPVDEIIDGVQSLMGSTLVAFLLAFYASGVRKTHDWHSFSQWFGVWVLLYPLLFPFSRSIAMFEVFEIAKRRVRRPI